MNRIFQAALCLFVIGLVVITLRLPYQEEVQCLSLQNTYPLRALNNKTATTLSELVKTKFFRILRMNLNSMCPLPSKKLCKSKSCSVGRCDDKDIPQSWIKTDKVSSKSKKQDVWSKERDDKSSKWVWHVQDEDNDKGEYFDVHRNVESYSGYNGSYIWSLIYEQNCFRGANKFQQMCLQQRTLYRIISGLHTSISSHLSRLFKNVTKAAIWADKEDSEIFFFNHNEYRARVLAHPEWINNMLFLYEILIRAVKQIIPFMQNKTFILSDSIKQDFQASKLLDTLINEIKKLQFKPLNQTDASFFVDNNPHVKQYQKYIHNISNILDCVDCQKCRLFGKMQTYGLGTALKILLGYNNHFKRNQIVALFNTLNKISISVNTYFNYYNLLHEGISGSNISAVELARVYQSQSCPNQNPYFLVKLWLICGGILVVFCWVASKWDPKQKVKKQFKHAFPPSKPRKQ